MKSFNWLHLTDLHFGLLGQASLWPNVREAFWDDLEKLHAKSGPWNAVLFTGDLVQSGTEAEFQELEEKVLGPLWVHLAKIGTENPVLLTVPGNHDLVRPELKKPKPALRVMLQKDQFGEISEEFWDDPSCGYREVVSTAFSNYQAWSVKNNRNKGVTLIPGCLPGDFAASIDVPVESGGPLKIGIAGINTTFLQLAGGNYIRRLALDPKQLHQACNEDLPAWAKAHDACILMTHQGPDWLDEYSATEAYSEINPAGRFVVHLFGHMHENVVRSLAVGGGKSVRQWQGNSLFSLEKFGDPPKTDRRHGYAAGRIEFGNDGATIQLWPRSAIKDSNGWRFKPDHDSCVLAEDGSTIPEPLDSKTDTSKSAREVDSVTAESRIRRVREAELQLQHALEAFKGQPIVFVEPKVSMSREFNDESNELHALMAEPCDALIVAPPGFGLTCLGLHLQLEALKKGAFWLYVDAEHTKGRKISAYIDERVLHHSESLSSLKCMVLDHWDPSNIDHLSMVKNISEKCPGLPIVVLAEDALVLNATGDLSRLNRNFKHLHLQALSRGSMRQLVAGYNSIKKIGTEDVVLSRLAEYLESINVHRTPINCHTVLRILDSSYSEKLLNKSKLLKAFLFVLFTDSDSFSHLSNKPEVEECTYVLGCFCKGLVTQRTRSFDASTFKAKLDEICKADSIVLNIDAMLSVLLENNILVRRGDQMEFRHRYWIFYFAAEWMQHDNDFRRSILENRNYVNYPEIIEFYSGIDGKRADALETLLADLSMLVDQVEEKIGIAPSFDPLSSLTWDPPDEFIQKARVQISERVESSNLPADIKDKRADTQYQSAAPYDQSIRKFLNDYSILSLLNSIKAASRALRSSPFVDVGLRHKVTNAIFRGWGEVSKVAFWLTPLLAKEGRAVHDGFAIMLTEGFSEDFDQRFSEIITSNPFNIVKMLEGDLASKKIGPLLDQAFQLAESKLQKHMIALFVATVRPIGWYEITFN